MIAASRDSFCSLPSSSVTVGPVVNSSGGTLCRMTSAVSCSFPDAASTAVVAFKPCVFLFRGFPLDRGRRFLAVFFFGDDFVARGFFARSDELLADPAADVRFLGIVPLSASHGHQDGLKVVPTIDIAFFWLTGTRAVPLTFLPLLP